jgi:hypothetical protein
MNSNAETKGFLFNRALDRGCDYSDYRRDSYPESLAGKDGRQ